MQVSRRSFFRRIGAGAVATAAIPALDSFALARGLAFTRAKQPGGPILLDRNENAYGPSPKVIAAIRDAAGSSNRYPRSTEEMEERLAHLNGVQRDQVVLTCGSGEVLRMAAEAFLGPGKKLVEPMPTFESLGKHAKNAGAEVFKDLWASWLARRIRRGYPGRCAQAGRGTPAGRSKHLGHACCERRARRHGACARDRRAQPK